MSDDGWKPLSPKDFARELAKDNDPAAPTEAASTATVPETSETSPETSETSDAAEPVERSLEDRLLAAQEMGLPRNILKQLVFIGPRSKTIEIQVLGVRRNPNDAYERVKGAQALTEDQVVSLCIEADAMLSHGTYFLPAKLRAGVETRHGSAGTWYEIPKGGGTTDNDVEARLILAIDFDVKRAAGISATDEELSRSVLVAGRAWEFLAGVLGGTDSMALLHSGNGRQIHLALDSLPTDDETKLLCGSILAGMDALFSTPEIKVDKGLFDAKRILPACGTLKKKGAPGIPERPHRRTAIVTPDGTVKRLQLEELKALGRVIYNTADVAGKAAMYAAAGKRPAQAVSPLTPGKDSPFGRANSVDPKEVVSWLGLVNGSGDVVCPGCSNTKGVSLLSVGLKCHHNSCSTKGVPGSPGFRTNVDLVMETRHMTNVEAVKLLGERFGFDGTLGPETHQPQVTRESQGQAQTEPLPPYSATPIQTAPSVAVTLPTLQSILPEAMRRAERRASGIEKPIPLPWGSLATHYGGGWWPGVHYICASTGIGKTAAALQMGLHGAKSGYPVVYVGLEMEDMQVGLRIIGEHGRVPWSPIYTGNAAPVSLDYARTAMSELLAMNLPFHPIFSRPHGWPPSELIRVAEAMRQTYPEKEGPGSSPLMLVLDFLQIIGREVGDRQELRERIGLASNLMREIAMRLNMVVIAISSIARDKYAVLADASRQVGLTFDETPDGRPVNRRMRNPDAIVGLGKESGDIEFSGDSVSAISRIPNSDDILWMTAKGRATGASWSVMRFTGFRYEEPADGGVSFVAAQRLAAQRRAQGQQAVAKEKLDKKTQDAIDVARYVAANPGCTVRAVRVAAVGDSSRRWLDARALLAGGLIIPEKKTGQTVQLRLNTEKLSKVIREALRVNDSSQNQSVDDERGESVHGVREDRGSVDEGTVDRPSRRAGSVHASTVDVDGTDEESERGQTRPRFLSTDVQLLNTWFYDLDHNSEAVRQKALSEGWSHERFEAARDWSEIGEPNDPKKTLAPETDDAPAEDASPTKEDIQAERDADALVDLFPKEQTAHMKDWTKERRWRARAALAKRTPDEEGEE